MEINGFVRFKTCLNSEKYKVYKTQQCILCLFQLQIIATVRERPLRATWATTAEQALPAAAV